MKTMNANIEALKNTISEYELSIDRETQRLAKNTQAKRVQIHQQLAELQAEITTHESNINNLKLQKQELASKRSDAGQQGKALETKKDELMEQIRFKEDMIKNCEKAAQDSLLPYGRNIKGVLNQINGCKWYGQKPLGPLGAYVKARDPQTWGEVLRSQLAQHLCSFAITDPRDRNQLKALLMNSQK
jgi:chromosome segregation ATPase